MTLSAHREGCVPSLSEGNMGLAGSRAGLGFDFLDVPSQYCWLSLTLADKLLSCFG